MNDDLRLLIEHLLAKLHHIELRQNELEEKVAVLYMSDAELAEHVRKIQQNKQDSLLAGAFDLPDMPKGIN